MSGIVFIGGVELSWHCLKEMCEQGFVPTVVFSYASTLAHRSGFARFDDLQKKYGFPLIETDNINDPKNKEKIRAAAPDLIMVLGWSQLVDADILSVPQHGCVGIHPTRLPEGRGRAPIPWTIIKGLKNSAVTLFFLKKEADNGDIIGQEDLTIDAHDDARSLYEKVKVGHLALVRKNLPALVRGTASHTPQRTDNVSYWPKRRPEDGRIPWDRPAEAVYDWVRALTHPYPGAFTTWKGKKLLVWNADLLKGLPAATSEAGTVQGEVIATGGRFHGGVVVTSAQDAVVLKTVQWEGEPTERPARELLFKNELTVGGRFE